MDTIKWFVDLAFNALCICAGIWLFGYIIKNGTGALKDLIRTISLTVKAMCIYIRKKIVNKVEEEPVKEEPKPDFEIHMTYEEFKDYMKKTSST